MCKNISVDKRNTLLYGPKMWISPLVSIVSFDTILSRSLVEYYQTRESKSPPPSWSKRRALRKQKYHSMKTKESQMLERSISALQNKIDNHDCKYIDGCPCYRWLIERYSKCSSLRRLNPADEHMESDIRMALEFKHGL